MKKIFGLAILFLLLGATVSVQAQWSNNTSDNLQISEENIWGEDMAIDSKGNTFYYYLQPEDGATIVPYVKMLDKDGNEVWNSPIRLSKYPTISYTMVNRHITVDKDDNLIAVVCDARQDVVNKDLTYTAYKISPEGKHLWSEDGVNLTGEKPFSTVAVMNLVNLEDNSTVFVFFASNYEEDGIKEIAIYMERLSASGEKQWNLKKYDHQGMDLNYPYVLDAGNNEFYMVYTVGTTPEIYMQKLDFDGNSVWAQPTLVYGLGGFGNNGAMQTILDVQNAKDGVIVCWNDDRGGTQKESVYMAYVGSDGKHKFASGNEGIKIGYAQLRGFGPKAVYDYENDVICVSFLETTANQVKRKVSAQLISAEGELLWDPEGIDISPLVEGMAGQQTIELGPKGTFCIFYMTYIEYSKTKLQALLVDKDGKSVWKDGAVKLTDGTHSSRTQSVKMMNNQWVVSFNDGRIGNNANDSWLFAQNLGVNGTLGIQTSNESAIERISNDIKVNPNPIKDNFEVSVNGINANERIRISLHNILGAEVGVLYDGNANPNEPISLSRPIGLEKGTYLLKINSGSYLGSSKIIVQ